MLAFLYLSSKNFSEPVKWTSIIVLSDSVITLLISDSRIILYLEALRIIGVTIKEIIVYPETKQTIK